MKVKKSKTKYVCEFCGKESTSQKKIEDCETSCRLARENRQKEQEDSKREYDSFFSSSSVSELANKLSDMLTKKSGIKCNVEFNVHPSESCSNTHSAPKGFKTNWRKDSSLPLGYTGLSGKIDVYIEGGYNSKVSDIFYQLRNKFRICTGCGGSRSHGLGYGVTLWADDFPVLGQKVREYINLSKQKREYDKEIEEIEWAYESKLHNFVETHPDYMEQQGVVSEAVEKLNTIKLDLANEFIGDIPKPTPHAKKVTKEDVDLKLKEIS